MEAHLRQKVHELLDRQSKVDMQEAEFSSRYVTSSRSSCSTVCSMELIQWNSVFYDAPCH